MSKKGGKSVILSKTKADPKRGVRKSNVKRNGNTNSNNKNKLKGMISNLDNSFVSLQQTKKTISKPKSVQLMNDLDAQLDRLNKTSFF